MQFAVCCLQIYLPRCLHDDVNDTPILQPRIRGKFAAIFQWPRTTATTDKLLFVRWEIASLLVNELLQPENSQVLHESIREG